MGFTEGSDLFDHCLMVGFTDQARFWGCEVFRSFQSKCELDWAPWIGGWSCPFEIGFTVIYLDIIYNFIEIIEIDHIPIVPQKAVAEDSEYRKPIGELGCCESRTAEWIHWWTERWLELCFLKSLQWLQWSPGRSPHPQLLDVVWCSAAVVVVVA
jgi:hypothetical protein